MALVEDKYTLHKACYLGDSAAVDTLLKRAAEGGETDAVDALDMHGNTPLQIAVQLNQLDIVRSLVKAGADPSKENAAGWSCFQEACALGNATCITLLAVATRSTMEKRWKEAVREAEQLLKSLPDYYMEVFYALDTIYPVLGQYVPSDTVSVWKGGCCIRLDMNIKVENSSEADETMPMSIIIRQGGSVEIVDHAQKKYGQVLPSPLEVTEEMLMQEVAGQLPQLIQAQLLDVRYDLSRLKKVTDSKGWFGRSKHFPVAGFPCQQRILQPVRVNVRERIPDRAAAEVYFRELPPIVPFEQYFAKGEAVEATAHLRSTPHCKDHAQSLKLEAYHAAVPNLSLVALKPLLSLLSRIFPMLHRMLPLLDLDFGENFPLRLDVPFVPGIRLTVETKCMESWKAEGADATVFDIPTGYERASPKQSRSWHYGANLQLVRKPAQYEKRPASTASNTSTTTNMTKRQQPASEGSTFASTGATPSDIHVPVAGSVVSSADRMDSDCDDDFAPSSD
jgi:hypothetical protein